MELRHSVEGTYHWQADGNERFYHVTLRPLYTRDASELLVFIQNVTETILDRRKKDELLYEYECYFQSTVNGVGLIRLEDEPVIINSAGQPALSHLSDIFAPVSRGGTERTDLAADSKGEEKAAAAD